MKIGTLPDGTRGVDVNNPLTEATAAQFFTKGFRFAVRYVRRSQAHAYDISKDERDIILGAGMGLMIVQHVAAPGWTPTQQLGHDYGQIVAEECDKVGIPSGVSTWLDMEGVKDGIDHSAVIDYCNAWHDQVIIPGLIPGTYVGDQPGLTATEFFKSLKCAAFWGAYNLNSDNIPITRGLQMRQTVAHPSDWIPGFNSQNMDVDIIHVDALGGTPFLLLP